MTVVMTDAWVKAEETCFTNLINATNAKKNDNAYLGMFPSDECLNMWMFTSGASSRVDGRQLMWTGTSAGFNTMGVSARMELRYAERGDAMTVAGKVWKMLQDTQSLHEKGNVQWLRPLEMPSEPVPVPIGDGRSVRWDITIPFEIIYEASVEYS